MRVSAQPNKASAPQPSAPGHAPLPPEPELAEAATGPTVGESTPGPPDPGADLLRAVVDVLEVPVELVVTGTVPLVARWTGLDDVTGGGVVLGEPGSRAVAVRGADAGSSPANRVPRGSPLTRSARTTRRVVASKRGCRS